MRSAIDVLRRDLDEMRAMAGAIVPAGSILASSTDPNIKKYLTVRRRFDYSSIVVGLYASFEHFFEDILILYVEELTKETAYAELPKKLVEKHAKRTGEFLFREKLDEARYPGATVPKLIDNLNRCLSGASGYRLNGIAIAAHDSNLRYEEITQMLAIVDISIDQLKSSSPMVDWFKIDQQVDSDAEINLTETTIRERLNDFIQRRNDVAHRGGNPSDRLSPEALIELVNFIAALSEGIYTLFVSKYLLRRHAEKPSPTRFDRAANPMQGQKVWIIKPPAFEVRKGQQVFGILPALTAKWGRIVNIQVDGESRDMVEASANEEIGVQFDFKAPKSMKIYVVDEEDEKIWTPKG